MSVVANERTRSSFGERGSAEWGVGVEGIEGIAEGMDGGTVAVGVRKGGEAWSCVLRKESSGVEVRRRGARELLMLMQKREVNETIRY